MAASKYLLRAGMLGALMMAALVMTSGPLAAQTQASFSSATNFAAGAGPLSVTTADFDGDGRADIATANFNTDSVSVLLNTTNVPPVAVDDTYTVNEDGTLDIAAPGVLGNDTDANNDTLTARVVDDAQHGTLTLNTDGSFTYAPNTDFNGTDSFTYEVCDGGDLALCDSATVTMTVTPVPDACTIRGTGKDDVLRGTADRDVICGGGDDDTVYGRGANDLIRGGVGNDTVRGNAGDDTLRGGDGRDRLYGDDGDDRLFGGAGTDQLNGGSGVNFTQQ